MKEKSRLTVGFLTWMTWRFMGPPVEMENTEMGTRL